MQHKILIVIILLFFLNIALFAKSEINGKVLDSETKIPIEFVSVALCNLDSTIINGTMTDSTGTFVFADVKAGDYLIKVKFIGYKDFISDKLIIANGNNTIPDIYLIGQSKELKEVTILGKRTQNKI
jgi:hypothetical protein